MITGGWEFIYAAYGLVWVVLGCYAVSLLIRWRNMSRKEKE